MNLERKINKNFFKKVALEKAGSKNRKYKETSSHTFTHSLNYLQNFIYINKIPKRTIKKNFFKTPERTSYLSLN